MQKTKTLAPINDLFDPIYKISYFCGGLSKYVENQLESSEKELKYLKHGLIKIFFILRCWKLFARNVSLDP